MSSDMVSQELIELRRSMIIDYLTKGKTLTEISKILVVPLSTISRDVKELKEEAKQKQQAYIDEELPFQHKLAVSNLDKIVAEAWSLYESERDSRAKIAALNVISDAVMKKQAVLGDPEQIEKAIKVVAKIKQQLLDQGTEDHDTEKAGQEEHQEAAP